MRLRGPPDGSLCALFASSLREIYVSNLGFFFAEQRGAWIMHGRGKGGRGRFGRFRVDPAVIRADTFHPQP